MHLNEKNEVINNKYEYEVMKWVHFLQTLIAIFLIISLIKVT